MKAAEFAITAYELHKGYKGAVAGAGLNGLNLEVRRGSIYGLLGPNGAGKTTAIRILSTLLEFDKGEATVAGYNVKAQASQVRQNIGVVGQYAAVDEILTGYQNLFLFARLHHLTSRQARTRAEDLLERFGLKDAGSISASQYSGGMRRRLDLAASLLVSPSVLFVDEPTTGLDPLARLEVWNEIRSLAEAGTTVLLTTQYLEEADQLADTVSMLKEGRVIAEGSPEQLKSAYGSDRLEIILNNPEETRKTIHILEQAALTSLMINEAECRISATVTNLTGTLMKVAAVFMEAGVEPKDISIRRATLEEVLIQLTGSINSQHTSEANL